MVEISPDTLTKSVALTATNGQAYKPGIVRKALDMGLYTAQHGHPLPLPLLLDVFALMTSSPPFNHLIRELPNPPIQMTAYDAWLLRFCEHAWQSFGSVQPSEQLLSFGALLMGLWPKHDQKPCRKWVKAYDALTKRPEEILVKWREPTRSTVASLWNSWFKRLPVKLAFPHAPYLWGKFHNNLLHERFDHVAAQLYLEAPSLSLNPYAEQVIRKLERRSKNIIPPYPDSYQELNPLRGPMTLDTLTKDLDYVMRKYADGGGVRLSNPVSSVPERVFNVYLYWVNGYAGLTTTAASILQALAVLLIDDWRFVMQNLPIHVHAHNANLASQETFCPGPRWEPVSMPQTAVKLFFDRPNWAKITPTPLQMNSVSADWACVCLLATDLAEFGIRKQDTPTGTIWIDHKACLPEWVSNIVIIETNGDFSHVCKVTRSNSQSTAIVPLPWPNWLSQKRDTVFHSVRERILDVMLTSLLPCL